MEFIAQQLLPQTLKQRYRAPAQGYFWNALEHLPGYELHGRLSWRRLVTASESAVKLLHARPPFLLFTDRLAGWREVHARRRWSPIRLISVAEAFAFLREHSHFRDGTIYADNYYLCDRSLRWFIAFCHHDGWHLWLSTRAASRPSWRRWQNRCAPAPSHPPAHDEHGE